MPEIQDNKKVFSLLEVTQSIQRTLAERYTSTFWVKAEMNKLNYYPHSGHCYPDLVEKNEGRIIAQVRSVLWKDDYHRINHNFLRVLHTPLKDGIKMLFCARITFDPVHGLALRIVDIDPAFSLGELEREKLETLETLKKEGLFPLNKTLPLPLVPQRVAVISVQTSKGYADFLKVIENNNYGFKFFHVLFPSLLQGDHAVESILYQMNRIRKVLMHFDVVAIIRGGGAEIGLSSFNNLELARAICSFPLPVITGIGHATNETVAEMVSHKNAITPTDLANFLIERFTQFYFPVRQAEEKLVTMVTNSIERRREQLANVAQYLQSLTENTILDNKHTLTQTTNTLVYQINYKLVGHEQDQRSVGFALRSAVTNFSQGRKSEMGALTVALNKDANNHIAKQTVDIESLDRIVKTLDPANVLKRGFSITRLAGRAINAATEIKEGDLVETTLASGKLVSEVKKIDNE